jgi:hypothetical protein
MSAFRNVVERKDPDALAEVLHPDVVFRSPAVYSPYTGAEATERVLRVVFEVFEDFRYTAELRDGPDEMLRFSARVGEKEIDGVDLVRYGEDGRITELAVLIRPLSGLIAVAEAVGARLQS